MKNYEPIKKPYGYYTMKQWAEKFHKYPIDTNMGTLCYYPDKDGNPPRDKKGNIDAYVFFAPEDMRALTAEDEKELIKKYKTYKPIFEKTKELNLSLDKELGQPIRKVLDKRPKIETEWDEKVANALKEHPFKKMDVGDMVAYDTETTGISPEGGDELLQITILKEDGEVLLSTYVKPYHTDAWPGAMAVNHITPEMVKNAPYPHEIAPLVRDIFLSAKEVLGYNSTSFDTRVAVKCLGIDMKGVVSVDPYIGFKGIKTESKHHKLIDAVEYYCPEVKEEFEKNAHDASADIKATLAVYYAFEKSRGPIIDKIMTNFENALLECKTEKEMLKIADEFKQQSPQSLKDRVIKDRANATYFKAKRQVLGNNKEVKEKPTSKPVEHEEKEEDCVEIG